MTVPEQIALLRRSVGRSLSGLKWGAAVAGALLLGWGIAGGGLAFVMVGLAVGGIALLARQAAPNLRRAARALDHGTRTAAEATIIVTPWSDTPTYEAVVPDAAGQPWRFAFVPVGWQPAAGPLPATVHTLPGVDWPVLVQAADGIFWPRSRPRRGADEAPGSRIHPADRVSRSPMDRVWSRVSRPRPPQDGAG